MKASELWRETDGFGIRYFVINCRGGVTKYTQKNLKEKNYIALQALGDVI